MLVDPVAYLGRFDEVERAVIEYRQFGPQRIPFLEWYYIEEAIQDTVLDLLTSKTQPKQMDHVELVATVTLNAHKRLNEDRTRLYHMRLYCECREWYVEPHVFVQPPKEQPLKVWQKALEGTRTHGEILIIVNAMPHEYLTKLKPTRNTFTMKVVKRRINSYKGKGVHPYKIWPSEWPQEFLDTLTTIQLRVATLRKMGRDYLEIAASLRQQKGYVSITLHRIEQKYRKWLKNSCTGDSPA